MDKWKALSDQSLPSTEKASVLLSLELLFLWSSHWDPTGALVTPVRAFIGRGEHGEQGEHPGGFAFTGNAAAILLQPES